MQKINLCKRSQVITRYALIVLSLILSYLKFCESHYLSRFHLSKQNLVYLVELYLFSEMRGPPSKNNKKEFELGYQGYIFFLEQNLSLIHLFRSYYLFLQVQLSKW